MSNKKTETSGVLIWFKCQNCGNYNQARVRIDDEDIIIKEDGDCDL